MELRHLRYFVAIAQEGSFLGAARRLGVSQPPLSTQIRDLERELGTALLHRSWRGATLTPAGEVFHAHACALLASLDLACRATRSAAALAPSAGALHEPADGPGEPALAGAQAGSIQA